MTLRRRRGTFLLRAIPFVVLMSLASSGPTGAQGIGESAGSGISESDSVTRVERGVSTGVERGEGSRGVPDPRVCSRCYEVMRQQTRECRGMENEVDRDVCLDAARGAYRRCSGGC